MTPYRVISTDDHLQEAPDAYLRRMSKAKWGDNIPQIRDSGDGSDGWYVNGRNISGFRGFVTVQGVAKDRDVIVRWADVEKCTYVPSERLKAMAADGVDVHSFYPNIGNPQTFNKTEYPEAFRRDLIRAVNQIQVEDYLEPYPNRFIALTVVPLWDPKLAVEEVQWGAARGMKGANYAFPQQFGYPHVCDKAWDPLWAALQEADLPVHLHIGSGGSMGMSWETWPGHTDHQLRLSELSVKSIAANINIAATFLFSGIFERFPRLKVVFAESGVGWIPYLLDTADHQWERQRLFKRGFTDKPSEVFRRHCYANFWYEYIGQETRRSPGLDNIMWLSDFPHPTSTYPTSQDYLKHSLKDCGAAERQQILVDTARKLYRLPAGY
jgi:predicted TIM-barrel fold metal-dependent hydrolase